MFGEDAEALSTEGQHRVEYWDYRDMGVRFVFRDEAIVGTRTIDRIGSEYGFPAVSPDWFYAGMTYEDVVDVLGGEPSHTGSLIPEMSDDFWMAIWDGCVSVSFIRGEIASVQTVPREVIG